MSCDEKSIVLENYVRIRTIDEAAIASLSASDRRTLTQQGKSYALGDVGKTAAKGDLR